MGDLAGGGVEAHVAGVALPGVAVAGELVVEVVAALREADGAEVEAHPGLLRVVRVEVDDDEQQVVVDVAARVGEELLVVAVVEPDVAQGPHRRVVAADLVDRADQRRERRLLLVVARLDLVLLGVAVLGGGVVGRLVLAQLVAGVDAVERHERGGEDEAQRERARRRVAQVVVEDVGRVGPERRPHVLHERRVGELGDVLAQLPRLVAPGEVRVALA